jgi:hypothetical protein
MPFVPEKKSHSYKATITVRGPKTAAQIKRFRAALKKAISKVRGKMRETKPKK